MLIYRKIAKTIPDLQLRLRQARMIDTDEQYIKKTWFTAMYLGLGILIVFFAFSKSWQVILFYPIIFFLLFLYFLKYVDVKISRIKSRVNQEIIFAGRFLIIELESGVPLYNAFKNVAKNYEIIGPYFGEIIEKVDLGTTLEDAINESISMTPSPNLRKVLWQLLNSMKTGSDVTTALGVVVDQIVREQQILVKEYGRKLNPIAMFYMMMAIIVPSLGTTMIVVLATFMGLRLSLLVLMFLAGLIGFLQFMFLSIIRSIRPPM
jgi:flagellar protein FlaJ